MRDILRRYRSLICVSVLGASLLHVDLAGAQPATRADEYADAQAKKAADPTGPLETRGERIARLIDQFGTPPTGFFPFIGNIYTSSWIAVGPGYRRPFENGAVVMAKGAWSVRNFKTADVQVLSPRFAADRLQIQGDAGWLDAPRLKFFGVGNDTDSDDRVLFGLRPAGGNVAMQFKAARYLYVNGGFGVEHYESRPRAGIPPPDLELTLRTTTLSATADWRAAPGWANSGGAVRVAWKGRRGDAVGFDEYEAEATELLPILRGNWVIALHGLATTTDTTRGDIPFFLLPNVGGLTTRGFSNFRFRDRHRLATSAELRWSASQFMDLALFVDAARVAATRSQLDFDDLHTSWGLGARFHTLAATVLRAEIARSTEGMRFTIGAGPVF